MLWPEATTDAENGGRRAEAQGAVVLGKLYVLFRSFEAGRAGPGVFLAQQVLPGRAAEGRDLQLMWEGVQSLGGVAYTSEVFPQWTEVRSVSSWARSWRPLSGRLGDPGTQAIQLFGRKAEELPTDPHTLLASGSRSPSLKAPKLGPTCVALR